MICQHIYSSERLGSEMEAIARRGSEDVAYAEKAWKIQEARKELVVIYVTCRLQKVHY